KTIMVRTELLLSACVLGLLLIISAVGCSVGPNYRRPDAPVATKWDVTEPWREAEPRDSLPKGQWWSIFHNDELNDLERQALDANQTLKVSVARLEQARAQAALQVSTLFPTLGVAPSVERQRLSGSRPAATSLPVAGPLSQTNVTLPFTVSYEVDLFGRRR